MATSATPASRHARPVEQPLVVRGFAECRLVRDVEAAEIGRLAGRVPQGEEGLVDPPLVVRPAPRQLLALDVLVVLVQAEIAVRIALDQRVAGDLRQAHRPDQRAGLLLQVVEERRIEAAGMGERRERRRQKLAQVAGEAGQHRLGRPGEVLRRWRDTFGREVAVDVELQPEIEGQACRTLADRRRHLGVLDRESVEDRGDLVVAQCAQPVRLDDGPPIPDRRVLEARPFDIVAAEEHEAHAGRLPNQLAQPGVVLERLEAARLRARPVQRLDGVDHHGHGPALLGRADRVPEVHAQALGQSLVEQIGVRGGDLPQQRLGPLVELVQTTGEDAVEILCSRCRAAVCRAGAR